MMTTYEHATKYNGGKVFRDREGNRAIYSDRADSVKKAFGRPIHADGTKGPYGELPDNMFPERYNVTEAHDFAYRIKAMGFVVYMAAQGHYGFISDEKGERVLSFQFPGIENTLSGNYGPPSRESGTGWRLEQSPESLRTIDDVRRALYAYPPKWCGEGWRNMTSLEQHLATYGKSSGYRLFGETK
jgi:hypothetical protein